mmetsp:Transcript_5152/g.8917  ORF Transcript_5152/g.8917 Transcript_5152/m.8917 type:complete len:886 (+) Transcript_5152:218-2875(+)
MGKHIRGKRHARRRNNNNNNNNGNGNNNKGGDSRDDPRRGKAWLVKATTNRVHREYYAMQGVFDSDADRDAFYVKMLEVLPITIRLDASSPYVNQLREKIETELSQGLPMQVPPEEREQAHVDTVMPPLALPWYPERNAWRFGVDRRTVRKMKSLGNLKNFLIAEEETGNIMRQEEASMIPPQFLDVQPHHKVLDMCAAPGSKTAQLLEAIHKDDRSRNFAPPTGLVVANDAAANRTHMLMNRMRATNSANLIVTCHNAQSFPSLENIVNENDREKLRAYREEHGEGFFDRILADVPCSGDGTLRKSPDLWRSWTPGSGLILHPLQIQIARRGLNMLRVGGTMVYSTCSINPMEDEAVVAQLLRHFDGAVELVDTEGQLPGLIRRAGKSTWKVAIPQIDPTKSDKGDCPNHKEVKPDDVIEGAPENLSLRTFETFEEYEAFAKENPPGKDVPAAYKSCFPPTEEEAAKMHLDRCMRIMPNDQDTGGFFVAVLKKVKSTRKPMPAKKPKASTDEDAKMKDEDNKEAAENQEEEEEEELEENEITEREAQVMRDDDMIPVPSSLWDPVTDYFGIQSEFGNVSQLFYRTGSGEAGLGSKVNKRRRLEKTRAVEKNEVAPKNITFLSKSAAEIIHSNKKQKLHVVNGGMVLLKRTEKRRGVEDAYRFTQGALELVLPFVTQRKVEITLDDFAQLIHFSTFDVKDPKAKLVRDRFFGVPMQALTERLQEHFTGSFNKGAVIAGLTKEDHERYLDTFGKPFALSLWAGLTLHALVNKEELMSTYNHCIKAGLMKPCTSDVESVLVEHLEDTAKDRLEKELQKKAEIEAAKESAAAAAKKEKEESAEAKAETKEGAEETKPNSNKRPAETEAEKEDQEEATPAEGDVKEAEA